jgi:2-polyprenyl-6-methoxyphenol hydroxylase-like FAD-dependent oxidoreductase
LIVGAGPVGLFLANECARRGLRFQIIETRSGQSVHSKALAIFPRTLEIFDMAGVVDPFLDAANRVISVALITHGRRLAHLRFAPGETPYSFVAMVPQNVTEQLLLDKLRRRGGVVHYDTSFALAEQHDDYVTATIDKNGQPAKVTASFVVGCDGAHSSVRRSLNLPLEGGEYDAAFMLADIETNDALPSDELQLCPSELGPLAIFPMSVSRHRIVATIEHPAGDAPSLDLVRKVLVERAPPGIEAHELHWSSYFHIHHRAAKQLGVHRVFIAGDAAHIHSPFGGQGMNTGLQDVWNLVWKLNLALQGRANGRLLETYTAERIPVIKQVIETTDFLTKVMGTPSKFAQSLRDTIIPMVSRLAPFQHAFVKRLSELGIAYGGSPIVEGPGERYFDKSVRGGDGIRGRFLLMIGDDQTGLATDAEELVERFKETVELRRSPHAGVALVRPDGYVAYSARNGERTHILHSLRSVLERQAS